VRQCGVVEHPNTVLKAHISGAEDAQPQLAAIYILGNLWLRARKDRQEKTRKYDRHLSHLNDKIQPSVNRYCNRGLNSVDLDEPA